MIKNRNSAGRDVYAAGDDNSRQIKRIYTENSIIFEYVGFIEDAKTFSKKSLTRRKSLLYYNYRVEAL
ncbi:MAG: hypothetical protein P9X24_18105 [Candidatus Hatepunaea meridiana]|nr:hypothetical protein [Candidatus Hatepunaea meridiana]